MYSIIRKQKLQTPELLGWQRQKTPHGDLQENGESWQGRWRQSGQDGGGKTELVCRRRTGYLFWNTAEHLCMREAENHPLGLSNKRLIRDLGEGSDTKVRMNGMTRDRKARNGHSKGRHTSCQRSLEVAEEYWRTGEEMWDVKKDLYFWGKRDLRKRKCW